MTLKIKHKISRCKLIDFDVKTAKRFYGCIPVVAVVRSKFECGIETETEIEREAER